MKSAREGLSNRGLLVPLMAIMLGILGIGAFTSNVFAGAPKALPNAPAAVVVVSPSNLNGWITRTVQTVGTNPPTSDVTFVSGPSIPPLGVGSVRFTIGSDGNSEAEVRTTRYDGTRLADLTALGYDTYVTMNNGAQAPFMVLNINFGTGTTLDDQLVFEPVYQTGTYQTDPAGQPIPNQCPGVTNCVKVGSWQHWDVRLGGLYSGFANNGPPLFTLAYYISQHPDARIVSSDPGFGGLRVITGVGGPATVNFDGNADNVSVGVNGTSTTFDFEPDQATPTASTTGTAVGTPSITASTTGTVVGTGTTTGTAVGTPSTTRTTTATASTTGTVVGTGTTTGTPSTTRTTTGTVSTTASTTGTVVGTGTTTGTAVGTPSTTGTVSTTPVSGRVEVCHRTGSARNPYVRIEISRNALPAHLAHGDIYPVPPDGCPSAGTATPVTSATVQPTETEEVRDAQFSDVPPGSTFYPFVICLAERNVLGGYSDGTYRPGNMVSRGQLSKIVANAAGFMEDVNTQSFSDVRPGDPFYVFVERLARKNVVSGFSDGTFRPEQPATRGQFAKIVSNAGLFLEDVNTRTFSDVQPGDPFYLFIERLAGRGILGGYSDGTFRPGALTSRGQAAKIVSNSYFVQCNPSSQR